NRGQARGDGHARCEIGLHGRGAGRRENLPVLSWRRGWGHQTAHGTVAANYDRESDRIANPKRIGLNPGRFQSETSYGADKSGQLAFRRQRLDFEFDRVGLQQWVNGGGRGNLGTGNSDRPTKIINSRMRLSEN